MEAYVLDYGNPEWQLVAQLSTDAQFKPNRDYGQREADVDSHVPLLLHLRLKSTKNWRQRTPAGAQNRAIKHHQALDLKRAAKRAREQEGNAEEQGQPLPAGRVIRLPTD